MLLERKKLIKESKYRNNSNEVLEICFQNELIKLEETLIDYKGEKDIKSLKTEIPDSKSIYITKKLA